jgi:hypothetical protein
MTSRRPDLVSRATRRTLRGLATEMYVKVIEGLWQDQGFVPVSDLHYEDSRVRRTTFESYAAGVDWTDVGQVERALRVFESQLRWLARQEWHRPSSFDEVRELLDHDGFELDERCRIRWRRSPALEATLTGLTDPSGIALSWSASGAPARRSGWRDWRGQAARGGNRQGRADRTPPARCCRCQGSRARPRAPALRRVATPRGPARRRPRAAGRGPRSVPGDRHGGVRRARPPGAAGHRGEGAQAQPRDAREAHGAGGTDRLARL